MAFTRPTLASLVDRITQDFVSRLELAAPILRRSMVYVMSRVVAGAAHMLHGHLDFLSKQVFPDLSEAEYLTRQANLFGVSRRPAEFAGGQVTLTGSPGAVVDLGSIFVRPDGARFEAVDSLVFTGTTEVIVVEAMVAGADGNSDAGTTLSLESPIVGVDSSAVVAAGGLVNGSDEESDDALRGRLLDRMRTPLNGGSAADYVAWALEVAGVTRAWVYPLEGGPGTVTVRFVRDNDASIIPDVGEVATVQAHVDQVAPVTALVTVAAPTAAPLNFTIALTPDTSATRAAVTAELTDLLQRVGSPGGTVLRSQVDVAIGVSEGVLNFVVTAPAGDVAHATGEIATMGTITWA